MMNKSVPTFALILCFGGGTSFAALNVITDTTDTTAVNDGTINGGEYVGSTTGINNGFGGALGSGTLYVDSSILGGLNFGLQEGGPLNDEVVVYIDSVDGAGFNTTSGFKDIGGGDSIVKAISGWASDSEDAVLNFAPGFEADYALAFNNSVAQVWQLANGGDGSHTKITDATFNNVAVGAWEVSFALADIGLSPGGSFDYVATYINGINAFRSSEFNGVASSTYSGGNLGYGSLTLAADDFNTFVTIPEPTSVGLMGIFVPITLYLRRRHRLS